MRLYPRIALFALMSLLLTFGKQSSAADSTDGPDPLEADLSRGIIRLDTVINDKGGNPVLGLKPEDVTLLDNGKPQRIASFEAYSEQANEQAAQVEIAFVIDSLNLAPQQLSTAKNELAKFLKERDGQLGFPTMVYRLSKLGLSGSERPSRDGNELADLVMKDREPDTIWNAPFHPEGAPRTDGGLARNAGSLKALGAIAIEDRKRPSRKLLFWVGPGWPTEQGGHYSFGEIVELLTRLREARLSLFSVTAWAYPKREFAYEEYLKGVKSEKDARVGDVSLEVLATKSGGVVTAPSFDLQGTIERCVEHANDFYIVSFDPPKADRPDEYHEIKIIVNGSHAVARTNFEYYDQPTYYDQPAAVQHLTVEQLQNVLSTNQVKSDGELAIYLSTIELTERLDGDALARAISLMRGKRSKDALISIANQSMFRPPPTAEIPGSPILDPTEQEAILDRMRQYVRDVIPNLPNFFATRTTIRYAEPGQEDQLAWKTIPVDQSLRPFGTERVRVTVRNSKEATDSASDRKPLPSKERNLFSEGAFGPIFSMVSNDILGSESNLKWIRWEERDGRRLAVFGFAVRRGSRDFEVGFCCLLEPDGTLPYKGESAYHGEMAVDPQNGAMMHISIEADLPRRFPIIRTAFSVDFSPLVIGGKTYICPTKSVYISRGRTVKMLKEWDQAFAVYGPYQTLMNDVTFTNYHLFRSGHRILVDFLAR